MKSMKWWMGNCKKYSLRSSFIFLIFVLIFTSGCSLFPAEEAEEDIPIIEPPKISKKPEYKVTRGTIEIKVKGQGQVFSNTEEYLYFKGSEEGSNGNGSETFRIKNIYVEPGQDVTAGQLLAELETENLDLEIQSSETQLKIEEQKLIAELRKEVMTEEERLVQEQAKADFRKKQIEHQKLLRKMENAQIIAPFDGKVMNVFYRDGDQVAAYEPVILLADMSDLIVGVRMTTNDQKLITIGQEATVEINGVEGSLTGKIFKLPVRVQEDGNGGWNGGRNNRFDDKDDFVLIDVDSIPSEIMRGTVANATVVIQRKENVLTIPLSTVRTHAGRNYVVVTDEEGKREVDVELGLQSATEVEIVSGLTEGQIVVGR